MSKDEFNAFLGVGTTYQGRLHFSGAVRVDGQFTGEITSEGTLILGKDAQVSAKVNVGQLILSGQLCGEIHVSKRTILHKSAKMIGNLHTPILIMEEGAIIQGTISMLESPPPGAPLDALPAEADLDGRED